MRTLRFISAGLPALLVTLMWSSRSFAVEYVTPNCVVSVCMFTYQKPPDDATPVKVDFLAGIPGDAGAPNLSIQVSGNAITVSGDYIPCIDPVADCYVIDRPRDVYVLLPILPVGHYTVTLFLQAGPSYPNPPPVITTSGSVYAGITISGDFDVVSVETKRVQVVEYYNTDFNTYFMTADANEISLLDAALPPFEDWTRTGLGFTAYGTGSGVGNGVDSDLVKTWEVCRFFNDSFAPKSTHFYATGGGCFAIISRFKDWKVESWDAFELALPRSDGSCRPATVPVYRLYNNGMGGAPNHRFTTSHSVRDSMIAQGWIPEGYGEGVSMCALGP